MTRPLLALLLVLLLPVGASGQADINLKAVGGTTLTPGAVALPIKGGSLTAPWFQALTDAVNGPVAVKGPFVPASPTDFALVVTLSPNGPVLPGLLLGQGSTTTAQLGPLAQGAVTTSAPSYTTGQTNPLSLDTSGNVRVLLGTGSATIGALTANQSVNLNQLAGTALSGANVVDTTNTAFRVNCVTGCTAGGSFTDNSAFTAGTTSESNVGGVYNDTATPVTSGNAGAARITAQRGVHVNLRNSVGGEIGILGSPLTITGAVTATIGAAVKPPFLPATAADPSLVVALSPVTPLPPGSNVIGAVTGSGTFTVGQGTSPWAVSAVQSGRWAVNQGSPAPLRSAWPHTITDDSGNGPVNVTRPFWGASAANPALVVAISPNLPANLGGAPTGVPVPNAAQYVGGRGSGRLTGITVCDNWTTVSLTTNTQIITGLAGRHTYFCSWNLVVAAATNVAVVSGTGSTCATGIGGVAGGTTAATGWNFAANGGIAQGSGMGVIGRSAAVGDNICILVSAANQTSGVIAWTQF